MAAVGDAIGVQPDDEPGPGADIENTPSTSQTSPHEAGSGAEEEDDEEEREPTLKYTKLTSHLSSVYRNGDSTSSFHLSGDKLVNTFLLCTSRPAAKTPIRSSAHIMELLYVISSTNTPCSSYNPARPRITESAIITPISRSYKLDNSYLGVALISILHNFTIGGQAKSTKQPSNNSQKGITSSLNCIA